MKDPDKEEEIDVEEFVPEDGEGNTLSQTARLKEKLKAAEAKAKEYLDSWQRAQADFVNMRKRDEEAKVEFTKFVNEKLISELIPVLDSFNLALAHGEKGIEPVCNQFIKVLNQNGLEESNPAGEVFDPKFHEAVGVVPTNKKEEDHKVLEVVQKGYILSGKIIRPAKVKIGQNND